MAKIIIFLLCLLLRSNTYAENYQWWNCNWTWSTAYGWVCIQPYQPPPCISQVEYQTLSCPVHYSGSINQSRTYNCSSGTWSAWTTTSNNCTQDPPTCVSSTETRQVACPSGYTGILTESRYSTCSDPYGSPTWTSWSTMSDTCTMTATNINNPISPISPISPTNPNSVISQQMNVVTTTPLPIAEPVTVQNPTATATTPSTTETTLSTTTTSATVTATEAPKGKEIVPGFGIVMSMQLLNQGYNMQQQQIEESIKLIQEQDYERQQNILLEFISANDTGDYLISASANRWRSILRDNPLQRFDLDD